MANLNYAVTSLRAEYSRLQNEMQRVKKALDALDGASGAFSAKRPQRVLSKEARRRIAEAQRQRWAKVRKAKQAKAQASQKRPRLRVLVRIANEVPLSTRI
jgi:hypothetical protein